MVRKNNGTVIPPIVEEFDRGHPKYTGKARRTITILSLDLATKLGWAFAALEMPVVSGVQNFTPNRWDGAGVRYLLFRAWLNKTFLPDLPPLEGGMMKVLLAQINATNFSTPNLIVYEEVPRHLGSAAAAVYHGFLAELQAWGEQNEIPYKGIPIGTIKKFATGKGNANKEAMMDAARARGWKFEDDNEADALWLLEVATDMMGVRP